MGGISGRRRGDRGVVTGVRIDGMIGVTNDRDFFNEKSSRKANRAGVIKPRPNQTIIGRE